MSDKTRPSKEAVPSGKTNWAALDAMTDEEAEARARSDPDAQPLTPRQLKAMIPLKALRGRPKSGTAKQLVSVRYSPEVLSFFKSTGDGWQSRMDGVLRQYVSRHSRRSA